MSVVIGENQQFETTRSIVFKKITGTTGGILYSEATNQQFLTSTKFNQCIKKNVENMRKAFYQ